MWDICEIRKSTVSILLRCLRNLSRDYIFLYTCKLTLFPTVGSCLRFFDRWRQKSKLVKTVEELTSSWRSPQSRTDRSEWINPPVFSHSPVGQPRHMRFSDSHGFPNGILISTDNLFNDKFICLHEFPN